MEDDKEPESDIPETQLPAKQVTVEWLIGRLQFAAVHMSNRNPNRLLMLNAAFALQQMGNKLAAYEDKNKVVLQ